MQDEAADDYTLYYHNLARLAYKSGRLDLVIAAWQNALKINPSDGVAKIQLEDRLRDCTEVEDVITEAKQKLINAPDDIETRHHLAWGYLSLGYVAEAKAQWEQVASTERVNWSKHARKMICKHCWATNGVWPPVS